MSLKIGVVGATGMVGETFMSLLEKSPLKLSEMRPFASSNSEGKTIRVQNQGWTVQTLTPGCFEGLDLVFFSSGDEISAEWAPQAVASGAFAVDNSAAFRMSKDHLLCVPEVNGEQLPDRSSPQVIANPNCSTIQLVVALAPLAKHFGLKDVHVATYQAVSGAGKAGKEELKQQVNNFSAGKDNESPQAFAHEIAFNCIPHIGSFNDDGFCSEEMKIMNETKKILGQTDLRVSAFTVRVPVWNGHSEAAWVTLEKDSSVEEVKSCLKQAPGIVFVDQNQQQDYPMVADVSGKQPVYVGRLHKDLDTPNKFLFWVVADNLLKGAALNGLQIAERIFDIK